LPNVHKPGNEAKVIQVSVLVAAEHENTALKSAI